MGYPTVISVFSRSIGKFPGEEAALLIRSGPKHLPAWELGYEYGLGVRTLVYPETSWSQEGEFGRDGYEGAFLLTDVNYRFAKFFAKSAGKMMTVKQNHHKIRYFI